LLLAYEDITVNIIDDTAFNLATAAAIKATDKAGGQCAVGSRSKGVLKIFRCFRVNEEVSGVGALRVVGARAIDSIVFWSGLGATRNGN
jgi:hypothetical protein